MNGFWKQFWLKIHRIRQRQSIPSNVWRRGGRSARPTRFSDIVAIEELDARSLLSSGSVMASDVALPTIRIDHPFASAGATGYTPAQLQAAYGFNRISIASGINGTGQTIAIVDAYNAPTIRTDLQAFDRAYGLPDPPSLTVMSQTGSTTALPPNDPSPNRQNDWEVEEALDVEWAHALAPGAKIVLVEANSANDSDLMAAVRTAASLPGVSVVSMSWGGSEDSSELTEDSVFKTPVGHQGVTFLASTGDSGQPGGFPAYSPNVVAVGGTTLNVGATGNYLSETAWADSGGGISRYESQPSYQHGVVTQSTTRRTIPDISFVADPNTGVGVYDSFSFGTATPWEQIGGTSLSAPAWAALVSIVNQQRVQNGLTTLDGSRQLLPMLYQLDQTNPSVFHDITSGNNGFAAGRGYDLVTGLGSPVVNLLVPALGGGSAATSKLAFLQSPTMGTAGQALNPVVKIAIENANGQVVTNNNSTVTLSIGSGPGGFAAGSTVSVAAVNGIATFSNLKLNVAGSYTLTASDTGATSATSSSLTIRAGLPAKIAYPQIPATGVVNRPLSPSVVVAVEDSFGNVVTSSTAVVTVTVASGPGRFTAGSTTTVTAVQGRANFSNLALGTIGTYTLSAAGGGFTAASTGITIGTQLTTPVLSIQRLSSSSVLLTWTPVSGAQGYHVYWSDGFDRYYLGTLAAGVTRTQVIGLSSWSFYEFQVEAYRGTVVADSNWVWVTTGAIRHQTVGTGDHFPGNISPGLHRRGHRG